jgi:hypothetical protein
MNTKSDANKQSKRKYSINVLGNSTIKIKIAKGPIIMG